MEQLEMQIRELQRSYAATTYNIDTLSGKLEAIEKEIGANKADISAMNAVKSGKK